MKCKRCQGLMVIDKIYDPDGQVFQIDIWRCLNCGETIDADILRVKNKAQAKEKETGDLCCS